MFNTARRGDAQAERRFFFFLVLPLQSVLLTAYVAPMYGFNALIQPFNEAFSPDDPSSAWAGALTGGALFLTIGTSGSRSSCRRFL